MRTTRWIGACCFAFLCVAGAQGSESTPQEASPLFAVRVITDEADAVLALLDKRAAGLELTDADWDRLLATEGYRRLKARDESIGIETFSERFRTWVLTVDLELLERLRSGVDRWRTIDAAEAGAVALAYLPDGVRLEASIYPVLKHTSNSFVYQVDTDPAIFMNVSGEATEGELMNTLAHELHHIGTSAGCTEATREAPSGAGGQVLRWMDGFAEGLAILAAAGGPGVHPHSGRAAEEWIVWERDIARFDRDVASIERFFLDILAGDLDEEAQVPRFFELINTDEVPQGPFYTVGWKMGALVEQRFGRQMVIDANCDMPRLLAAYNQIALEHPRNDGSLPTWNREVLRAVGAPDVVGTWLAQPTHGGQRSAFVLRFELDDKGGLQAALSLPQLAAWDLATLPVTLEDDRVLLGRWPLTRQPDGGLSGVLPPTMVPVHQIALTFHPSEPIAPTDPPTIEAPIAEPVWTRDLGSPIWAGLSTADGVVYVGDDSGRLSALDAVSGESLWTFETGAAIRARPTVTDTALLVHSDDGSLYCLERASGELLWSTALAEGPVARIPLGAEGARYNHYASSAIVDGDTIYVGGFDGRLQALDSATGETRWAFAAADTIAGIPATDGERVYFGSFDGNVYGVDVGSGKEIWRYPTGAAVVSSPLVHDGRVIIGSRSYDILALDAATGEFDWKYYYWFSWVESSAVERDGTAYIGSSDSQLVVAMDAVDGTERWRFDSGGSPWSTPAVTEASVFIGTVGVAGYWTAHEAALFALDRTTGEVRWHYPIDRPGEAGHWGIGASTAADDELLFVGGLDGTVKAFPQAP